MGALLYRLAGNSIDQVTYIYIYIYRELSSNAIASARNEEIEVSKKRRPLPTCAECIAHQMRFGAPLPNHSLSSFGSWCCHLSVLYAFHQRGANLATASQLLVYNFVPFWSLPFDAVSPCAQWMPPRSMSNIMFATTVTKIGA